MIRRTSARPARTSGSPTSTGRSESWSSDRMSSASSIESVAASRKPMMPCEGWPTSAGVFDRIVSGSPSGSLSLPRTSIVTKSNVVTESSTATGGSLVPMTFTCTLPTAVSPFVS